MHRSHRRLRVLLLVLFVSALVCAPFALWGEGGSLPRFEQGQETSALLVASAVGLLAADSVAPVPSTLVIMALAAKVGWLLGIFGGTLGLVCGVLAAAWLGRSAIGRIAPRFVSDAELARMRLGLERRLGLTLACLRSVPVLAETSVLLAAAMGVPIGRIVRATLLPNLLVAATYSLAADDSFTTAAIAFLATLVASLAAWRWLPTAN